MIAEQIKTIERSAQLSLAILLKKEFLLRSRIHRFAKDSLAKRSKPPKNSSRITNMNEKIFKKKEDTLRCSIFDRNTLLFIFYSFWMEKASQENNIFKCLFSENKVTVTETWRDVTPVTVISTVTVTVYIFIRCLIKIKFSIFDKSLFR